MSRYVLSLVSAGARQERWAGTPDGNALEPSQVKKGHYSPFLRLPFLLIPYFASSTLCPLTP